MTTYRVQQRVTVRSEPKTSAQQLGRLDPTRDGKPRLITGRPALPGWVEWIEGAIIMGYIKRGALRELQG
jgi:hypothetical protein